LWGPIYRRANGGGIKGWENWPDLTLASYLGLAEIVDGMISQEQVDINAPCRVYGTALEVVTTTGHLEVIQAFLRCRDEVKITEAVVKAAAGNKEIGEAVMALLLDKRGDEIKITEAVVVAAAENEDSGEAVMVLLLDKRGDEIKITKAVVEVAAGNEVSGEAVMALLLEKRPNDIAACISESVCRAAATCGQYGVLDLICRNGFLPLQDEWISTANFYNAAKSGDVDSVKELLAEGIKPDAKNIRSVTPLWIAAARGHKSIVELLVGTEHIDVNSLSISGRSPIFWPSALGMENIVALLIDAGADLSFVDENGDTAASIARREGHMRVVRILERSCGI
jgi:Ankyrin repeats (3 copies)